jgi:hypothetical protein
MEQEKKINVSIADGDEFFAHEVTINFNPSQFIFDFKCITPRSDPRNQQGPTLAIKHNTVMLDIYHAKKFHQLMTDVIGKYEKDFGKIEKPKAIEKAEKMRPQMPKQAVDDKTTPSYFG